MEVVKTLGKGMVPRAGVEPARPFGQRILSPQRLPFRHPGMLSVTLIIPRISVSLKHQYPDLDTALAGIGHKDSHDQRDLHPRCEI